MSATQLFIFTGPVKDHKALGKGNSSLPRVLQAGWGQEHLEGQRSWENTEQLSGVLDYIQSTTSKEK